MTTWAEPDAVEAAAQEWSDAFVSCRIYGHKWRALTAWHYVRQRYLTVRVRCASCRSEKEHDEDERGYPISGWRPTYTSGYLLKNLGRVGEHGKAVLRLAALRNLTVTEVEDEE